MKKIIISTIIISLTFFIVNHFNKPKHDNTLIPKNQNSIKEKVEDINVKQIELGLYKYHGKNKERELIKEHKSVWEYHKDIESFEVFYTKQQFIDSNYFQDTFKKYYEFYKDIDNYKIGYHIKFQTIKKSQLFLTFIFCFFILFLFLFAYSFFVFTFLFFCYKFCFYYNFVFYISFIVIT